jgi:Trp operon repressor
MDIAALSISMSQAELAQEVGVSIAKLSMDNAAQDFEDLTKMMEQSVNPNIGSNIDISI